VRFFLALCLYYTGIFEVTINFKLFLLVFSLNAHRKFSAVAHRSYGVGIFNHCHEKSIF